MIIYLWFNHVTELLQLEFSLFSWYSIAVVVLNSMFEVLRLIAWNWNSKSTDNKIKAISVYKTPQRTCQVVSASKLLGHTHWLAYKQSLRISWQQWGWITAYFINEIAFMQRQTDVCVCVRLIKKWNDEFCARVYAKRVDSI